MNAGATADRPGWWKRAVVYQVYPASFADSDGDGFGDLGGVIQHLDHLTYLGVDVLWLSPIFPTPWDDGGYDISDYQDIEPRFGTLATFDELLRQAHERGLRVILDLVANHTSDEHPWFVESRSSEDNSKRDWYYWRPPRPGFAAGDPGAEPTNWLGEFSQSVWTLDEQTGEYYLHLYSAKQPDLNWENPAVRQAVYAMMRWWLDRGVDGFRMDVINKISKRMPLRDVPSDRGFSAAPIERGRERSEEQPSAVALAPARSEYVSGPRVHEFVQELHRKALAPYGSRLLNVGETSGVTVEEAALFTDQRRSELDMIFTFEHVRFDNGRDKFDKLPLDLPTLKAIMTRWQLGLGDVSSAGPGWNSLYWCNHDQPRVVSRWGNDRGYRSRSAAAWAIVLHLQRGTPYIYQGEELGMTNYPFSSLDEIADVQSLNHAVYAIALGDSAETVLRQVTEMGRDNARTPMHWSGETHAGFSSATPWQPVHPNHVEVNVEAQRSDPNSVLNVYRELIRLRHDEPVVTDGDYELLLPAHPQLWAFTRSTSRESWLVVANLSDDEVELPADVLAKGAETVLATVPGDQQPVAAPWEARVLRLPR